MDLSQFSDNTLAWVAYAVSALGCLFVTWRIALWFDNVEVRKIIGIVAAAVLMTPAYTSASGGEMAPAFMVLVMEFLANNDEGVMRAGQPLVTIILLGVSISLVSLLVRKVTAKTEAAD
jgi:ABC-type Mn2+/Zn2+ transport system permease subunit